MAYSQSGRAHRRDMLSAYWVMYAVQCPPVRWMCEIALSFRSVGGRGRRREDGPSEHAAAIARTSVLA